MGDETADIDDFLSDEPKKKKDSFLPFLAALGLISVVAVGAGWILSDRLGGSNWQPEASAKNADTGKKTAEKGDKPSQSGSVYVDHGPSKVVKLEPVLVSLAGNSKTFLRMELALVLDEDAPKQNEEARLRVGSEIASYASTLSIQQISGPSGFLHLREDLLDRARLATAGAVNDLLILSMVAE